MTDPAHLRHWADDIEGRALSLLTLALDCPRRHFKLQPCPACQQLWATADELEALAARLRREAGTMVEEVVV